MGTGAMVWRRVVAMAMVPVMLGMTVAASAAQDGTPSADVFGDDGVLTNCVDPSFPPMEYFESQEAQEPIGFDIDLINAIGERLGVEVDPHSDRFHRATAGARRRALRRRRQRHLSHCRATGDLRRSAVLRHVHRAPDPERTTPKSPPQTIWPARRWQCKPGRTTIEILNDLNTTLQEQGQPAMDIQSYPDQTDAIQQLVVGRADATITQDTEAAFRETAQPGQFTIAYTYPDPQTFGDLLPTRLGAAGGGIGGDGRGYARRRHIGRDRRRPGVCPKKARTSRPRFPARRPRRRQRHSKAALPARRAKRWNSIAKSSGKR